MLGRARPLCLGGALMGGWDDDGHLCWDECCDGGPHSCICGNDCEPPSVARVEVRLPGSEEWLDLAGVAGLRGVRLTAAPEPREPAWRMGTWGPEPVQ